MEHEGEERERERERERMRRGQMEGGRQANNNLVKAVFLLQPCVDQLSPQSGRKLLREGGRKVIGMKEVHCPLCLWPHLSSLPKSMCLQGKGEWREKQSNAALPAASIVCTPVATYFLPESRLILVHHSVGANMDGLHLACYKLALQEM